MRAVTQQNAALVEQAAAAAGSLQDQTLKVQQTLTVFKLVHQQMAAGTLMPGRFERPVASLPLQKKAGMRVLAR